MQIRCEGCGQLVPGYDVISYGSMDRGYKELCGRCFNSEVAKLNELHGFESPAFRPVVLADSGGGLHEFHFRSRLLGDIVSLEALEIRDGSPAGYQFQIIGDPRDDALALLGRLIERMRRALSIKHLEDGDHGLAIADHQTVRGRIDWDEKAEGRVPLLVIDGAARQISPDRGLANIDELEQFAVDARRVREPFDAARRRGSGRSSSTGQLHLGGVRFDSVAKANIGYDAYPCSRDFSIGLDAEPAIFEFPRRLRRRRGPLR